MPPKKNRNKKKKNKSNNGNKGNNNNNSGATKVLEAHEETMTTNNNNNSELELQKNTEVVAAVDQTVAQQMEQLAIQPAAASSQSQQPKKLEVVLPKEIEAILVQLRSYLLREKITTMVELRIAGVESHPGLKKLKEWSMTKRNNPKATASLNYVFEKMAELFDLEGVEVYHLPHVALLCGTLVECGADEELGGRKVIQFLKQSLIKSARVSSLINLIGDSYEMAFTYPINKLEVLLQSGRVTLDDIKHWRLLKLVVLPVMTMLAKNIFLRMEVRADKEFIYAMYSHIDAIKEKTSIADSTIWLRKTLALDDDIDVMVLHPELQQGCIVETEAIFNCYHFFTLLQDVLTDKPWGQRRTIPHSKLKITVEIAKGDRDVDESRSYPDAAQWDYHNWTGLDGDNPKSRIYGLARLSRLPKFSDDEVPEMPIVILKRMKGSPPQWCDEVFEPLHSAMLSEVCVKKFLTKEEVEHYLTKIRSKHEIVPVS